MSSTYLSFLFLTFPDYVHSNETDVSLLFMLCSKFLCFSTAAVNDYINDEKG